MIAELGVKDMAALQKLEWATLNEIGNAVVARMNPPLGAGTPIAAPGAKPRVGWGPTVDGRLVTMRSFFEGGPEVSKNVPMLIGSVSEEGNRMLSRPTEAEWLATLTKTYGEARATALVAALKKAQAFAGRRPRPASVSFSRNSMDVSAGHGRRTRQ